MAFTHWLRNVFGPRAQVVRASRRGKSRQPSRQRRSPSFRPILEGLEDRTLLSGTRPFWIFGHNPNSVAVTEQYLKMGVNALEPDLEYFAAKASDPVSQ